MANPIHILLVDDDTNYSQLLGTKARTFGMKLNPFTNFEEGLQELRDYPFKYKGLIFDARCLIKKKQEIPHDKALSFAIADLQAIENELNITYPLAVNTGYIDFFLEEQDLIHKRRSKIFNKGLSGDDDALFLFLQEKIHHSAAWKYADIFEIFDSGYLTDIFRTKLLYILQQEDNIHEQQNVFAAIRVIQEEIYRQILQRYPAAVPNYPNPSFSDKNKHLSGNKQGRNFYSSVFQTSTIDYLANAIYRIASDYGSHLPQRPTNVPVIYWETPSVYATKSLIFALMEQLLWLKTLMTATT